MRSFLGGTTVLGLGLGLAIGFGFANLSHRFESQTQSQIIQLQPASPSKSPDPPTTVQDDRSDSILSREELEQSIANADNHRSDKKLQRDLGLALFRYAQLEGDTDLLSDVVRLLDRASQEKSLQNKDLYQTLGDSLFILAKKNDLKKILATRDAYKKALQLDSADADLLINIGLTFESQDPADYRMAIKQYNQALQLKQNYQKGLEFLARVLVKNREIAQAEIVAQKIKLLYPSSNALAELQASINQEKLKS